MALRGNGAACPLMRLAHCPAFRGRESPPELPQRPPDSSLELLASASPGRMRRFDALHLPAPDRRCAGLDSCRRGRMKFISSRQLHLVASVLAQREFGRRFDSGVYATNDLWPRDLAVGSAMRRCAGMACNTPTPLHPYHSPAYPFQPYSRPRFILQPQRSVWRCSVCYQ